MGRYLDIKSSTIWFMASFVVLAVVGYVLYSQFADYTLSSKKHFVSFIIALIWSLVWLILSAVVIYWKRQKSYAPALAVLATSIFFLITYGLLFRGTEYGMNGHWGDNGYRLAMVCKMMAYNHLADAHLKNMTSMYPALWFYLSALGAKLLSMEAYQTIKYGYFLIFLVYPWLLYFSWKLLVKKHLAALIAVGTTLVAHDLLLYIYYEHMSLALFIPWWLYFFEEVPAESRRQRTILYYATAILIGAALITTYYWWFALAAATYPFSVALSITRKEGLMALIQDFKHKAIITTGILLLSSFYWFPLVQGMFTRGYHSSQASWFRLIYADLSHYLFGSLPLTLFTLAGIFLTVYFWENKKIQKMAVLYMGGLLLIIFDRFANIGFTSIQTRKLVEFIPLLLSIPVFIGGYCWWDKVKKNVNLTRAMWVLGALLIFHSTNIHGINNNRKFQIGLNQRKPQADIDAIKSSCDLSKVFLTNRYLETCYLPYYLFIPNNSTAAHLFSEFDQRELFLKESSKIVEPRLFSYALAYNRFDTISYFYIPYDTLENNYNLQLSRVPFNTNQITPISIRFADSLIEGNPYFTEVHERGIYSINADLRSVTVDEQIRSLYPEVYKLMRVDTAASRI